MIKNILLGYSGLRGGQVALSQAVDLAHATQGRLHVTLIEPLGAPEQVLVSSVEASLPTLNTGERLTPSEDDVPQPTGSAILDQAGETCRLEGVTCTLNHHYGEPVAKLLALSRVADLLVVGRRDEPASRGRRVGRIARQLAARAVVPTLFTDREHLPLKSATLLYEPRSGGGRALGRAGEICALLNVTLNVVSLPWQEITAAEAEAEARRALRAYHLDGSYVTGNAVIPALQEAALTWSDPLLVIPALPRKLLFNNMEPVMTALALPNVNVLLVP